MFALKPILILGKVFGLLRFRVIDNELVPVHGKMKCVVICILGVYFGACTVYFSTASFQNISNPLLKTLYTVCAAVIFVYFSVTLILQSIIKSNDNVRIISLFAELDSKLCYNMRRGPYKRSRRYTVFIIFYIIFINLLYMVLYYLTSIVNIFDIVIIESIYILLDCETALVCMMLYMLKFRLAAINRSLEIFTKNGMSLPNSLTMYQPHPERLSSVSQFRHLSFAYVVIGETCALINNLFNFHISMVLLMSFLCILVNLSLFLQSIHTQVMLSYLLTLTSWCGVRVSYVFMLSYSCEYLLRVRSKTKELVNALVMDYELPAGARAQAKAFMELIDAWPLRIHVYDMFPVDISLLLRFISVCTTYLIILIQISGAM